jgi:hypothetical protein
VALVSAVRRDPAQPSLIFDRNATVDKGVYERVPGGTRTYWRYEMSTLHDSENDQHTVTELHRRIEFSIDGKSFSTTVRRQPAADLLRLAGLDPSRYDLGRLHGHRDHPSRFRDDEIVEIHPGDRFVSIRQRADVA